MSNDKVLLSVAVIAFILSLVSAVASIGDLSPTGNQVSKDADAQLTVSENLEINFTTSTVDWGSGRIDTGKNFSILDTEGNVTNSSGSNAFNTVNNPLVLENLGNTNASINLSTNNDASNFIGGGTGGAPSPEYQWKVSENQGTSCPGTLSPQSYSSVSTSGITACSNFSFDGSQDEMAIDLKVKVPYDTPTTSKTDTITATATAV